MMVDVEFSDDQARLNVDKIHLFLTHHSSWAQGISKATVAKSIAHSVCIGGYVEGEQVAFCRLITDHATFANLVDVVVWPDYRGLGISKLLMQQVMAHPSVADVRRFTLATSDAHGLYQQFGFGFVDKPETLMQIYKPDIYQNKPQTEVLS
ncbi:N-acetyltransferase [Bacterioplanes sanyensis]|uniref:GNAT family N-acetyltransferase n=1 Tax=Bacterioplanes sanyensis TaxID=1249553 RepID=UPI0019A9EE8E|nr:GNAT family N-acetyltransferase [Bacterioplanes sanyensis]GGY56411.1 N-acetyltransferase [Bacterioplanes sanyensis]